MVTNNLIIKLSQDNYGKKIVFYLLTFSCYNYYNCYNYYKVIILI